MGTGRVSSRQQSLIWPRKGDQWGPEGPGRQLRPVILLPGEGDMNIPSLPPRANSRMEVNSLLGDTDWVATFSITALRWLPKLDAERTKRLVRFLERAKMGAWTMYKFAFPSRPGRTGDGFSRGTNASTAEAGPGSRRRPGGERLTAYPWAAS